MFLNLFKKNRKVENLENRCCYTVQRGDTIDSIAKKLYISRDIIIKLAGPKSIGEASFNANGQIINVQFISRHKDFLSKFK